MDNELLEKLGKLTQEILYRVKVDALECIFECDIDKTAEWLLLISFCPTIRSAEDSCIKHSAWHMQKPSKLKPLHGIAGGVNQSFRRVAKGEEYIGGSVASNMSMLVKLLQLVGI